MKEASAIAKCLNRYSQWTGHEINWQKSFIHYSRNVSKRERGEICNIMGI